MISKSMLNVLMTTIKLLNSSQDTNYILTTLLEQTISNVQSADAGILFLWNEKKAILEPKHYINMRPIVEEVRLKSGESMAGKAFKEKKVIFYKTNREVRQNMATMTLHNHKIALKTGVTDNNMSGSICCPLISRGVAMGVLVLDSFIGTAPFTENDVEFIKLISEQATTAIVNSIRYAKEKEQKNLIQSQYDALNSANRIHKDLTHKILNGSNEHELLKTISEMTQTDAFIVDRMGKIAHNCLENDKDIYFVAQDVLQFNEKLNIPPYEYCFFEGSYSNYAIFPIMVRKGIMGWLCLLTTDTFEEKDHIAAERVASVLAIHYLKEFELFNQEMSLRGGFVDQLIQSVDSQNVEKFAHHYGLKLDEKFRVHITKCTVRHAEYALSENEVYANEVEGIFLKVLETWNVKTGNQTFITRYNNKLIVIIPEKSNDRDMIFSIGNVLKRTFETLPARFKKNVTYHIGLSGWHLGVSDFKYAFDEAQRVMRPSNKPVTLDGDKIMLEQLLRTTDKEIAKRFVESTLKALLDDENKSKSDLLKTLKLYVANQGAWSKVKTALNIHGNTLTYRLRKIEKLIGYKISEYPDRLILEIACELHDIYFV